MTQPLIVRSESKLERVRQQFEHWRETREKKGRIPESLWDAAVELTRDYPLLDVSRALRLDYSDLKNRSAQIQQRPATTPEFLELNVPRVSPAGACLIEITRADGARMMVRLNSVVEADLPALAKTFLSNGS